MAEMATYLYLAAVICSESESFIRVQKKSSNSKDSRELSGANDFVYLATTLCSDWDLLLDRKKRTTKKKITNFFGNGRIFANLRTFLRRKRNLYWYLVIM